MSDLINSSLLVEPPVNYSDGELPAGYFDHNEPFNYMLGHSNYDAASLFHVQQIVNNFEGITTSRRPLAAAAYELS